MSAEAQRADRDPAEILRPLRRVRQVRQFTDQALTEAQLDAIVDVGRWSGSSRNSQPWRFIVIRDASTISAINAIGAPHTRALTTAVAAIAVALPADPDHAVSYAYDDGRAAERMLIAVNLLGLAGAIAWLAPSARSAVGELLGVPDDHVVRTIVALGHPAPEGLALKKPGVPARLPRSDTVFAERWPASDGTAGL